MEPARAFIDLNENMPSGISIGDKVNNLLNGGDKMRSLYRDFKEEV